MQPSETGRERANAAGFAWQGDDVFGRIAHRYDRLCDLGFDGRIQQVLARDARCRAHSQRSGPRVARKRDSEAMLPSQNAR